MDCSPPKLSVPFSFRDSYESLQRVEQLERSRPKYTRTQIRRLIFRAGLEAWENRLKNERTHT